MPLNAPAACVCVSRLLLLKTKTINAICFFWPNYVSNREKYSSMNFRSLSPSLFPSSSVNCKTFAVESYFIHELDSKMILQLKVAHILCCTKAITDQNVTMEKQPNRLIYHVLCNRNVGKNKITLVWRACVCSLRSEKENFISAVFNYI